MAKNKSKLSISTLFLIIQLIFFVTSTVKSFQEASADSNPIWRIITVVLLGVFVVAMGAIIILNLKDKKAMKKQAGDVKYAVSTTKNTVAIIKKSMYIINVLIALVIAIDTFKTGDASTFRTVLTIVTAVFSLFSAVFFIIKKARKMNKKSKKREAAKEKAEAKQLKIAEKENTKCAKNSKTIKKK